MASLEYVPRPVGRPRIFTPEEAKARNVIARRLWRKRNMEHLRLYDRHRRALPGAAARKAIIGRVYYLKKKARGLPCVQRDSSDQKIMYSLINHTQQ